MVNKKILITLVFGIFLMGIISAEVSYCCEKTKSGAWCMDADQDECNPSYRSVPTSCEATSYCKLGTCIDSNEGTCIENTPQKVCDENDGVWVNKDADEITTCQLGCCLIGEQAAFITQSKCKRLSAVYGLETNYRTDIQNEIECIASATSSVEGACVIETDYQITCKRTTQKECLELQTTTTESSGILDLFREQEEDTGFSVKFYEGYLCSSEELETNCGPGKQTTCVEGKDEVYFLDTCGNLANVYDASKINDKVYWNKITEPSCGSGSNADSKTCGDCDYYLGSTCKKGSAQYGNYVCEDLGCYENGKKIAEHGETWCADIDDSPGSRYLRYVCYNGEVTVEPCADYRNEVCLEDEVNGYSVSGCVANRWQDCSAQITEEDCENLDKRDCVWTEGKKFLNNEGTEDENKGYCVPEFAPGFDFWSEETEAESICSVANNQIIVKFEKKVLSEWKCVENCEYCYEEEGCTGKLIDGVPSWEKDSNSICSSLGDCGIKKNYVGAYGDETWEKRSTSYEARESRSSN